MMGGVKQLAGRAESILPEILFGPSIPWGFAALFLRSGNGVQ